MQNPIPTLDLESLTVSSFETTTEEDVGVGGITCQHTCLTNTPECY